MSDARSPLGPTMTVSTRSLRWSAKIDARRRGVTLTVSASPSAREIEFGPPPVRPGHDHPPVHDPEPHPAVRLPEHRLLGEGAVGVRDDERDRSGRNARLGGGREERRCADRRRTQATRYPRQADQRHQCRTGGSPPPAPEHEVVDEHREKQGRKQPDRQADAPPAAGSPAGGAVARPPRAAGWTSYGRRRAGAARRTTR